MRTLASAAGGGWWGEAGSENPEAVGHDDEERAAVYEGELLVEELCVALWLAPELGYRAEVAARGDQGDADLVAAACGRLL
jgi:hypothetical protein